MAEETPKYALENLVVDYNSQASELQDGDTLTGAHMQRIDSALDSAAKAEKVAEALNELDNTVTTTKTNLEN
jgi:coenzyme F420-reducing hydrogenase delta subunit